MLSRVPLRISCTASYWIRAASLILTLYHFFPIYPASTQPSCSTCILCFLSLDSTSYLVPWCFVLLLSLIFRRTYQYSGVRIDIRTCATTKRRLAPRYTTFLHIPVALCACKILGTSPLSWLGCSLCTNDCARRMVAIIRYAYA
ncbi:uncharacterized protein SCHCODRAFT_02031051 [Schizophyllum commune H4-8]|uniref:uncharacterized protein n=1 Tax=Schizophyllum commune (strain H4-8 / FGSC 9210) TaxID=578458 RepID=UPI0021609DA4|nr:uncharacterized protein SCHCODRAFT_02031051 [Schizophyllum commune H4-8]KAI5900199.1 hypothetical protein SCHCODRAFT_02031051 [Schizophyllum commune H4-8]